MSVTIAQYLRNELAKAFGSEVTVSDEDIGRSLLVGHLLSQGKATLKELLPSIEKNAKVLHAAAYEFYQKDQFEKAYKLFAALCIYDPKNIDYLEGWAATSKLLKKHNDALVAYHTLTEVNPIRISYYLDLAEEFYKIRQPEAAVKCCEAVEFMAKEEPFKSENSDVQTCLKKATVLRRALTKNLKGK